MIDWYKIINVTDFEAEDLPSRNVEVILEGVGLREVLVTKGTSISVLFDDVFLQPNLNDHNPFIFEDRAVYLDINNDLWVGVVFED